MGRRVPTTKRTVPTNESRGSYQLTNAESFKPNVNVTRFNDHGVLEANGACTQ